MKAKAKPKFGRRIFWDVDFDNIDYSIKYKFVIERVFERRMWRISEIAIQFYWNGVCFPEKSPYFAD